MPPPALPTTVKILINALEKADPPISARVPRRQGCREAEDLRFGQAHLFARGGQAQRHAHDIGLSGGEVVAQIHQIPWRPRSCGRW